VLGDQRRRQVEIEIGKAVEAAIGHGVRAVPA
jgi:hypothetical protein